MRILERNVYVGPSQYAHFPVIRLLLDLGVDPARPDGDGRTALELCVDAGRWPLSGLSVTIPHKEAVFAACSHSDDLVKAIGAANTLWFDDGDLVAIGLRKGDRVVVKTSSGEVMAKVLARGGARSGWRGGLVVRTRNRVGEQPARDTPWRSNPSRAACPSMRDARRGPAACCHWSTSPSWPSASGPAG